MEWIRHVHLTLLKADSGQSKASRLACSLKVVGVIALNSMRSGAHINVEIGKTKGPHILFEGNQRTVDKLTSRLFEC